MPAAALTAPPIIDENKIASSDAEPDTPAGTKTGQFSPLYLVVKSLASFYFQALLRQQQMTFLQKTTMRATKPTCPTSRNRTPAMTKSWSLMMSSSGTLRMARP